MLGDLFASLTADRQVALDQKRPTAVG